MAGGFSYKKGNMTVAGLTNDGLFIRSHQANSANGWGR